MHHCESSMRIDPGMTTFGQFHGVNPRTHDSGLSGSDGRCHRLAFCRMRLTNSASFNMYFAGPARMNTRGNWNAAGRNGLDQTCRYFSSS